MDQFHPSVAAWFAERFGAPTEVQRRAWQVTAGGSGALIAAPTGSGKTLAAFLAAINDLILQALAGGLAEQVQVLYVSPLKALSNDIDINLQAPLTGIAAKLGELGLPQPAIRTAVRTGDTPIAEREKMRRTPPHLLVTTPESLYILLTSASGRKMLRTVKTVIVDELHAVAGVKRGAHLMLTLERLTALTDTEPVRIGLSATVKPLDAMARFLIGGRDQRGMTIIDAGHTRRRDLALEVPRSPLSAVMSNEVWGETYDRLAQLVCEHRTTLIFVNQRRVAERCARHLAERLGDQFVTAHHGSLAREHRLSAEQRLKAGQLKALVATSSLELGIDIGEVDLVCQLGSPRALNAFVQRVGRSGHAVGATPKGRLFPLSLDDLLECSALIDAVERGELDAIRVPRAPLDVLAQQIVAEIACREWDLQALYDCLRRAEPYRDLSIGQFEQVVQMLAEGYSTRRGRRGAYLHYDAVNRVLRARRGARLTALTNAGVIPDQFDYDVVLLPEEHRIGTLNEDFAFESLAGDIFQLGNASYRIVKVETGRVLVDDARGQPPTMPFWLGEALGRSDELSRAVSNLIQRAGPQLDAGVPACAQWLTGELGLSGAAAHQLAEYLGAAKAALGVLPSATQIVFERFFDDVGDTHLVIHSPFGSRINRAWGLSLRKRMCRKFNFELQASALEDSIVLSLGPSHSFALEELKDYLKSANAAHLLVQALLDAPMFGTRWRWNATAALAVKRMLGGKRAPPQFQRSDAQDLLTVIFPDQLACAENLVGEREVPDHPLVAQTIHDCLHETMDVAGFIKVLEAIEAGDIAVRCCELAAPSPLAHAILNAKPFAFLDDGAAEERRTRAVSTQPLMDVQSAAELGKLDAAAIARVREEARPTIGSADELHDALVVHGFLCQDELGEGAREDWIAELIAQRRMTRLSPGATLLVAAERLHELCAVLPGCVPNPAIDPVGNAPATVEDALREVIRSRLELLGPIDEAALAAPLALRGDAVRGALIALEVEGAVMRGAFTAADAKQWCDRRLLARMHRYTRDRLRAEIQPASAAQFMCFLFHWHQLASTNGDERHEGEAGLIAALRQLEGFAAPAPAWEDDLLIARVKDFSSATLDRLCSAGRIGWWRMIDRAAGATHKSGPVRGTPILLGEREALAHWRQGELPADAQLLLSGRANKVLQALREHGASFYAELRADTRLLPSELHDALAELVAHGLVSCDSFAGLRALVLPAEQRRRLNRRRPGREPIDDAGRWSLTRRPRGVEPPAAGLADPRIEHIARVLLRRYGVVFRKLLEREDGLPPWRDLFYVYRRMEARGEIRGGRFVSGFSGEQFALPEASAALRRIARSPAHERVSISALDCLNLAGIVTPGEKVSRLPGNRLLFEAGVLIAVQSGADVRYLKPLDAGAQWTVKNLLIRKHQPASFHESPARAQ